MGAHRLQQAEGADDIGLEKVLGAMDGAVHMRLGGEVDDGPRLVRGQQAADQLLVADVALHEDMALVALQRPEVFPVAGIGQLVEIDDGLAACGQPVQDEVGADKAGAAGN